MQNGDMTHIMPTSAFHLKFLMYSPSPIKAKNLFIKLQYYFSRTTYQVVRDILINISTTLIAVAAHTTCCMCLKICNT